MSELRERSVNQIKQEVHIDKLLKSGIDPKTIAAAIKSPYGLEYLRNATGGNEVAGTSEQVGMSTADALAQAKAGMSTEEALAQSRRGMSTAEALAQTKTGLSTADALAQSKPESGTIDSLRGGLSAYLHGSLFGANDEIVGFDFIYNTKTLRPE